MKRLACVLLVFTLLLTLCACHGKREIGQFAIPNGLDESKQYEITFWAKNDTNKTQVEIYEKAAADFEEYYPNIHVNIRLYTDYSKIYNDVITNISSGTTPNVCITYPDHIATYLKSDDVVVRLDSLINDERYGLGGSEVRFDSTALSEVVPKFMDECILDDGYYALPFMRSTEACYVNKTYVEKLGYTLPETLTWEFVWEVSEAALEKNEDGTYKVNGQKTMIPFIYKSTDNMMISYLAQTGAGYSTSDGQILMFSDETAAFLEEIYAHAQSRAFSTFKISSYPANFLNAGQCIFAIDSTAGATWMGTDAPLLDIPEESIVEFETAVMEIPQADTENPRMISQGPSVCIFNKDDAGEVLASWLFAQFLLTNDVQIAYSSTEGYAPVTLKAQNTEEYKAYLAGANGDYAVKLAASKLLLDNIENTFVTPVFDGSADLRDAAGELIESVTKAARRKQALNIEKVYSDTISQKHLDTTQKTEGVQSESMTMPAGSILLLSGLALTWIVIGLTQLLNAKKSKKN